MRPTKKTTISFFVTVFFAVPACGVPVETSICETSAAIGFSWKDGSARQMSVRFEPFHVHDGGETRVIKFPEYKMGVEYVCQRDPESHPGTLFCTSTVNEAVDPIIFRENKFERVINFSARMDTDGKYMIERQESPMLAVSYGTCKKL